jgi:hypothetical protein
MSGGLLESVCTSETCGTCVRGGVGALRVHGWNICCGGPVTACAYHVLNALVAHLSLMMRYSWQLATCSCKSDGRPLQ